MVHTSVTVGLPVRSLPDAIGWYRTLLGSKRTLQPFPHILEFEVVRGFWLQLVEDRHREAGDGVLRFGVADVAAERERLVRAGVGVGPVQRSEGRIAYCRLKDPYGNKLCLYEAAPTA